jgi:hypothetical protein
MILINNNDEFDHIYEEDAEFVENEKQDQQYYLGLYETVQCFENRPNHFLLTNAVSPKTFFRYSTTTVTDYLDLYSVAIADRDQIDIMKMTWIQNQGFTYYTVILKTHWLRLVQRHWKKVYDNRQNILNERRRLANIHHFELTGNHCSNLPSLWGMMGVYNQNQNQNT